MKELALDIFKDGGSQQNLFVKFNLAPVLVYLGDTQVNSNQTSAPSSCEEFSLSCEFVLDRWVYVSTPSSKLNFLVLTFPSHWQNSFNGHYLLLSEGQGGTKFTFYILYIVSAEVGVGLGNVCSLHHLWLTEYLKGYNFGIAQYKSHGTQFEAESLKSSD